MPRPPFIPPPFIAPSTRPRRLTGRALQTLHQEIDQLAIVHPGAVVAIALFVNALMAARRPQAAKPGGA